jgi:hypothetical protein
MVLGGFIFIKQNKTKQKAPCVALICARVYITTYKSFSFHDIYLPTNRLILSQIVY